MSVWLQPVDCSAGRMWKDRGNAEYKGTGGESAGKPAAPTGRDAGRTAGPGKPGRTAGTRAVRVPAARRDAARRRGSGKRGFFAEGLGTGLKRGRGDCCDR